MTAAARAHFDAAFAADRDAPRFARGVIGRRLREAGFDGDLDLVVLLASEVVTNAVVHSPRSAERPIEMTGDLTETSLRLVVANRGPSFAWQPATLPGAGPGGRGLSLVDRHALDWGVCHDDGTTAVWFEVDAAAASGGSTRL